MGFMRLKAAESLQEDSLFFTSKSPEVSGTPDPWIGNTVP